MSTSESPIGRNAKPAGTRPSVEPDRVGHGQERQPEGERDAHEPDPEIGKRRREHGAAASPNVSQNVPNDSAANRLAIGWRTPLFSSRPTGRKRPQGSTLRCGVKRDV
jgi:hypothetical protein